MLKKLAKYGNSTALVIDKALLEILGMEENSVVKLQTDGKSLIITPVKEPIATTKAYYETDEALNTVRWAAYEKFKTQSAHLTSDQRAKITESADAIVVRYANEMQKYLQISATPEFKERAAQISKKYDPSLQSVQYCLEFNKLRYEFCPQLEKMDQEMIALEQKYLPKNS